MVYQNMTTFLIMATTPAMTNNEKLMQIFNVPCKKKAFLGLSQWKVNCMVFYKSQNIASPGITVHVSEHTVGPKHADSSFI